jgi:ligand-binding sensor domain-containing protein
MGTRGGVAVYDILHRDLRYTHVLEDGAELVVPDLMSNDIFYISAGVLFRWNPYMTYSSELVDVGMARSLGTGPDYVYVEKPGSIVRYSKMGMNMGQGSAPANAIWAGPRAGIDPDDISVLFLAPFFTQTRNLGRVDYTVYYRDSWRLWVGTWGDGVHLYDANLEFPKDTVRQGINPGEIDAVFLGGEESEIWIGGPEGFSRFHDGGWTEYSRDGDMSIGCPEIVDITGNARWIWFATECGVTRFSMDGDGRFWSFRLPPQVSNWLTCCHLDSAILWLGTDDGIVYMDPETGDIAPVEQSEGLYVNRIDSNRDRVFFATDRGVVIYDKRSESWGTLTDRRGWSDFNVETCLVGEDSLHFATPYGILRIHDADTLYLSPPFNPVGQPILALCALNEKLFVGTPRGLYRYDSDIGHWSQISRSQGLIDEFIHVLASDPRSGSVYMGTSSGLSMLSY